MKILQKFMALLLLTTVGSLQGPIAPADGLTLTSPQVKEGELIKQQQVFSGYGCKGGNVSPALSWSGVPEGTQSLAVTVYDPDAANGWWHWLVVNLPAAIDGLAAGAGNAGSAKLPTGSVQVRTSFGEPGYGGPCPPRGDAPHHYHFTVYALDVDAIKVHTDSTATSVNTELKSHALATATLTGLYRR